jgi:NAD(P)-dependent dehydrogenase (short-subunit alcohol dehydrogenase family)
MIMPLYPSEENSVELGLKGKNVLITGGSKGIGLACARLFRSEGARVALVSRTAANLQKALGELPDAYTVAANLIDAAGAALMVKEVEAKFGPIDILVNSAGAARRTPHEDLTPMAWRDAMDAKYFTYINVIDPLIKRMASRGHGVIVNVIGHGGKVPAPTHLGGGAANAALMLATAGLANAYAGKGVRVVGVNPGLTKTERVAEGMKADAKIAGISEDEALKRALQRLPLGRMAEADDIANVVVFAASERGAFLTGANITMDGAGQPVIT